MSLLDAINKVEVTGNTCNYILLGIDAFLCKEDKLMRFSVDEESLENLKKVMDSVFRYDDTSKILVCAYKDKLRDKENNEFIYGDCIWISTNISIKDLTDIFEEKMGSDYPSDIGDYFTISELIENNIMFVDEDGSINEVMQILNYQELKQVKVVYWD